MSLVAILIASLLGSPHCAAMCGGFVAAYAGSGAVGVIPHLLYNFGRLFTYITLGILAGLVGASIEQASSLVGIQRGAAVILGGAMVLWGVLRLFRVGDRVIHPKLAAKSSALIRSILNAVGADASPSSRAFLIGALSTLLPCGWLYMFAAVAASSGAPLRGAIIMAVFWVGTVPMMLLLGGFSKFMIEKLGHRLPTITALLIIAAGIFAISGRFEPHHHNHGDLHQGMKDHEMHNHEMHH